MKKHTTSIILFFTNLLLAQANYDVLPNLTLKTINGKNITIQSLIKDEPVLINFWATWCAPCKKEMRHLKHFDNKYSDLSIIAINVDKTRSLSQVRSVIRTNGYDFTVGLDPNSIIMNKLNASVVPTNILVNSEGEIVWQHQGYLPGDEVEMEKQIKKLLQIDSDIEN